MLHVWQRSLSPMQRIGQTWEAGCLLQWHSLPCCPGQNSSSPEEASHGRGSSGHERAASAVPEDGKCCGAAAKLCVWC